MPPKHWALPPARWSDSRPRELRVRLASERMRCLFCSLRSAALRPATGHRSPAARLRRSWKYYENALARSAADGNCARHLGQHIYRHNRVPAEFFAVDGGNAARFACWPTAASDRAADSNWNLVAAHLHTRCAQFLDLLVYVVYFGLPPAGRGRSDVRSYPTADRRFHRDRK